MLQQLKSVWLVCLFFSFSVLTTGKDITQLEQQLSMMPDDTAKIRVLLELGSYYCYSEADKALLYLQEALVLSTRLDFVKGVSRSYFWQGKAFYYKDQYTMATQYNEKARVLFEETEDWDGMMIYQIFSGNINDLTGNYPKAIRSYQNAIEISKKMDNPQNLYLSYCGLGKVYLSRSELELAKTYFKEALALSSGIKDPGLESILFTNLGRTYEFSNNYDSAMVFYEMSLQKRKAIGGERAIASSEYNIGSLLVKRGQYQEALNMLEASLEKYRTLKDDTGICVNMIEMAKAYYHTGLTDRSEQIIREVLVLADKLNNLNLKNLAYLNMAPIMALSGRYDIAYEYMVINKALQDSLAEINKERIIRELEVQFQTERKKDEIQILKGLNELQKRNIQLLYVSLSGSLIILVLVFVLFRYKSKGLKRQKELYRTERSIREQEAEIREKEQQLLEGQLDAKKRELASKALEMLRVNESIGQVIKKLKSFMEDYSDNESLTSSIRNIASELETQLKNNSWTEFEKVFNNVHAGFYKRILTICPELTSSELKIAVLLNLNLNTKEIAAITFRSEAAIKSTRYRLRRKLGVKNDQSLIPFLMQLD